MRLVPIFATAAIIALVSASAMAQTSTTQPAPAGQATTGTKTTTGTMMKKAPTTPAQSSISKACSAQADAKNLHGKAREKFRSECKKNGGKG